MQKSLPFVSLSTTSNQPGQFNYYPEDNQRQLTDLKLNERAWPEWLQRGQSFRVVCWHRLGEVKFNVLPDKRKGTTRLYWSAWKSVRGKTRKFYLGPTDKVTKARLGEAGTFFIEELNRDQAELIDVPCGWEDLTPGQKAQVEDFIQTLLWPKG